MAAVVLSLSSTPPVSLPVMSDEIFEIAPAEFLPGSEICARSDEHVFAASNAPDQPSSCTLLPWAHAEDAARLAALGRVARDDVVADLDGRDALADGLDDAAGLVA